MTPVLLAELVAAVPAATDISMCHAAETGLATSVTATPAERGNRQRDAVLVVGQDRMRSRWNDPSVTSMSLPKNP